MTIHLKASTYEAEIFQWFHDHSGDIRTFRLESRVVNAKFLTELMSTLFHDNIARSLVWVACRCVPEPRHCDEAAEVSRAGFSKEFSASLRIFSDRQIFPYDHMLPDSNPDKTHFRRFFTNDVRMWIQRFCVQLSQVAVLYPRVQRKKNVSRETAQAYIERYPDVAIGSVRTVDLEIHYGRTGEKIMGGCELRSAWKFNDLKPRFYYCQGGRDYWASRYMKNIAVLLMNSIPYTTTSRRHIPETYIQDDLEEDSIVTWDFESFTTTLSELKFFLHVLADAVRGRIVDVRLFDYKEGLVHMDIGDLIDQYNETVNFDSPFSIARVVDRFFEGVDGPSDFEQQNSGMLGVAGNIGFSTALHGYVMGMKVDSDKGVCVGDDAKASWSHGDPRNVLVPHMSRLGRIHPEKFGIEPPGSEGPYRFLKRGWWRSYTGLWRDFLIDPVILPLIDGRLPAGRTPPPDFTTKSRIDRCIKQIGKMLWDVLDKTTLGYEIHEIDLLEHFLKTIYKILDIPFGGAVPGQYFRRPRSKEIASLDLFVPSLQFEDYDPRYKDWLEFLVTTQDWSMIRIPLLAPRVLPIPVFQGEEITSTKSLFWSAMEDLEYIETEMVFEVITVLNEANLRRIRRALKREQSRESFVIEIRCRYSIPDRFYTLLAAPFSTITSIADLWETI